MYLKGKMIDWTHFEDRVLKKKLLMDEWKERKEEEIDVL